MGDLAVYDREQMIPVICELVASGDSLRKIGKTDGMPSTPVIVTWLQKDEAFQAQYARAKALYAEHMAEEIAEIADNGSNDWMATNDPENPGYSLNGEHVQRSRLRIDTRKWLLSKLLPKKYGEKVDLNVNASVDVTLAAVSRAEEIRAKLRSAP